MPCGVDKSGNFPVHRCDQRRAFSCASVNLNAVYFDYTFSLGLWPCDRWSKPQLSSSCPPDVAQLPTLPETAAASNSMTWINCSCCLYVSASVSPGRPAALEGPTHQPFPFSPPPTPITDAEWWYSTRALAHATTRMVCLDTHANLSAPAPSSGCIEHCAADTRSDLPSAIPPEVATADDNC